MGVKPLVHVCTTDVATYTDMLKETPIPGGRVTPPQQRGAKLAVQQRPNSAISIFQGRGEIERGRKSAEIQALRTDVRAETM